MTKPLVATALISTAVGFFICCFIVYPPHAHWNDDLHVGDVATWFAACGSIGAAWAAVHGANTAMAIATQDRADRKDADDRRKDELLRAMADALYSDLRTVIVFIASQFKLARGIKVGDRAYTTEEDFDMWCIDMGNIKMVAFDKYADALPDLGRPSTSLIFAYGDFLRIMALIAGYSARPGKQNKMDFVRDKIAHQLPKLLANLTFAMDQIEAYVSAHYERVMLLDEARELAAK